MINVYGDAWELLAHENYDVLCITTNGYVKRNGECVMGAGIAKTARDNIPGIALRLGTLISKHGNRCFRLTPKLATFVVKHNWYEDADLDLIRKSCKEITEMADKFGWSKVLIPRPGCGNGKLSYKVVEPILQELLDDRFHIVTWK
jgi:hypothetical protein